LPTPPGKQATDAEQARSAAEADAARSRIVSLRWVIAHVDVPGEVGPDSGCRTGVYAFEVGEQVRMQPVNLAAGFQRLELRAAVERLSGVKPFPDLAEPDQGRAVERHVYDGFRWRVAPGHQFHGAARGKLHGNRVAVPGGREPDVPAAVGVENGQLRVRGNAESAGRYAFLQQSGADAWGIGQQAVDVRRSGEPDPTGSRFGLPVSQAATPR
jgi:hypothetical protein